jgi:hypothetical protein
MAYLFTWVVMWSWLFSGCDSIRQVEVNRSFGVFCCLTVNVDESSETSECLYYTARRLILEDGSLRSHGREKHISKSVNVLQENNSRVYREPSETREHRLNEPERESGKYMCSYSL